MAPGDILFHRDFLFADGQSADKYLVVLGKSASHVVAVKTTSRGSRYRNDHGCQAGNHYPAFLLTKGCCCLPSSTWVCLNDFYEIGLTDLSKAQVGGAVYRYGCLDKELARDLQACAATCDDVSGAQEALIRRCFID